MQIDEEVRAESPIGETHPKENAAKSSPRAKYLKSIGLVRDPFALKAAEQEAVFNGYFGLPVVARPGQEEPDEGFSPLAYFVRPGEETGTESALFRDLRSSRPSFVFGAPGTGKTTLRLALDAVCRRDHDQTLVVTFSRLDCASQADRGVVYGQSASDHWQCLTRDLATDLFIQVIEQYDFYSRAPGRRQMEEMAWLLEFEGGGGLWRLVDDLLALKEEPADRYGIGKYWRDVDRFPVHYVIWSPQLRAWLGALQRGRRPEVTEYGAAALRRALAAASLWGFERTLVLIDGVDNWWRRPEDMKALIKPLWDSAATWQQSGVAFKYFLTNDLRETIIDSWIPEIKDAALRPIIIDLFWPPEKLRKLLRTRFQAAGSNVRAGFGDLVESALGEKIDGMLIEKANGSPRSLLQLVDALLDAHLRHTPQELIGTPEEPLISADDWEYALLIFDLQNQRRETPKEQRQPIDVN